MAVLCVAAIALMIRTMTKNVVFFKTVSQAVHDRDHDGARSLRIGGAVVPGSIHQTKNGVDFAAF